MAVRPLTAQPRQGPLSDIRCCGEQVSVATKISITGPNPLHLVHST